LRLDCFEYQGGTVPTGRPTIEGDDMTGATEASTFMTWFQEWGPVGFYTAQIIFCLVLSVVAVWAAATFKKLVDLKKLELGLDGPAQGKSEVTVEEFVD
jgi:hypothetical protein